jgi:pyruvate,orthophosphate dikinase
MTKQWVYEFKQVADAERDVGGDWEAVRSLLGGKGANLGEMTRAGVPVPSGFTVTTEACNAFLAAGEQLPDGCWDQMMAALASVEADTGKRFGDAANPLLVSCRSGAKFSMPGMMDTVLNIGLNDKTVKGLIDSTGDPRFAYDAYRRLVQMFGSVVMRIPDDEFEEVITDLKDELGIKSDTEFAAEHWMKMTQTFLRIFEEHTGQPFPEDPYEQLRRATEAVFKSWFGRRAVSYRNAAEIPHDLGTGVNVARTWWPASATPSPSPSLRARCPKSIASSRRSASSSSSTTRRCRTSSSR